MYNSIEIGKKINQRRKDLNLTLKDVADKVGVASSTISRYENGDIDHVKLPVLESIAKVLLLDVSWLIGKTSETNFKPMHNPYDYIRTNWGDYCVELIKTFINLNNIGQKKVLEYIKDLGDNYNSSPENNYKTQKKNVT